MKKKRKNDISGNPKEWTWIERNKDKKDVDIIETQYIFCGPHEGKSKIWLLLLPDEMASKRLRIIGKTLGGK